MTVIESSYFKACKAHAQETCESDLLAKVAKVRAATRTYVQVMWWGNLATMTVRTESDSRSADLIRPVTEDKLNAAFDMIDAKLDTMAVAS